MNQRKTDVNAAKNTFLFVVLPLAVLFLSWQGYSIMFDAYLELDPAMSLGKVRWLIEPALFPAPTGLAVSNSMSEDEIKGLLMNGLNLTKILIVIVSLMSVISCIVRIWIRRGDGL